MDGIVNANKPTGLTSFDVVARLRHWSHERRVGHAGTLDPRASGVLPVCVGQATRVVEFMLGGRKSYRADIELGATTDSYDAEGNIVQIEDPSLITLDRVQGLLPTFRGSIMQSPPPFSSVKHRGKRLYQLARAGVPIRLPPRPVEVYDLVVTGWPPPVVTLEAECGQGTYIRSIAHDLGQALGCGAHLKDLVRLSYGPFRLEDAIPLPQIETAFLEGREAELLHPLDLVLAGWGAVTLDREGEQRVTRGLSLQLSRGPSDGRGEYIRAYSQDGSFLAVLRSQDENGLWLPKKVFSLRGKEGSK